MSDNAPDNTGWTEWSKHVLKALERLDSQIDNLRSEVSNVHQDLVELKASQTSDKTATEEIKTWKKEMSEVCSPPQMLQLKQDVEDLKSFKTKAMTMFVVAQGIIGVLVVVIGWVVNS